MVVATLSRTMVYVRPQVFRVYGRLHEDDNKEEENDLGTLFFGFQAFLHISLNCAFFVVYRDIPNI